MAASATFYCQLVLVLSLLWICQIHTVSTTIGRYGGAFRRPLNFGRPHHQPPPQQQPFPGQLVASPTHAYSILAKPQNIFKPQPQPQPIRYQNPPLHTIRFPIHQQQPQQQQQQLYYQQPVQQQIYQPTMAASNNIQYQQQPSTFTSGYYSYQSPSSTYAVPSNVRPNTVHYHVHSTPTKLNSDTITSGSNQILSYESCSSSHWQPLQQGLSTSASSPAIATAPSSQSSTYFYGGSVSPIVSSTKVQQVQRPTASNKIVVLSHDVLKTLLANKQPVRGSSVAADSVGSASSNQPVFVTSNNASPVSVSNVVSDQPSVKLVGYIGPSSGATPTGYIQIPINKNVMEGLSGPQTSYDFALNATNYSLFTLKSVNDVQTILGTVKGSGDSEASASQSIPLGLVVSNQQKAAGSSEPLFYSSAASSPVATITTTTGEVVNPSVQMVGHVQITSPDVSSHFVKRKDDDSKAFTS